MDKPKRGRPPKIGRPMTPAERMRQSRAVVASLGVVDDLATVTQSALIAGLSLPTLTLNTKGRILEEIGRRLGISVTVAKTSE